MFKQLLAIKGKRKSSDLYAATQGQLLVMDSRLKMRDPTPWRQEDGLDVDTLPKIVLRSLPQRFAEHDTLNDLPRPDMFEFF